MGNIGMPGLVTEVTIGLGRVRGRDGLGAAPWNGRMRGWVLGYGRNCKDEQRCKG